MFDMFEVFDMFDICYMFDMFDMFDMLLTKLEHFYFILSPIFDRQELSYSEDEMERSVVSGVPNLREWGSWASLIPEACGPKFEGIANSRGTRVQNS